MSSNILLSFPNIYTDLRFHNLKIEEHENFYVIKFLTDQNHSYVHLEKYIRKNVIYYSYSNIGIPKKFLNLEDFESKKQIKFKLDYDNKFYQNLLITCAEYKIRRPEIESYSFAVQYVENQMDYVFGINNWIWKVVKYGTENEYFEPWYLFDTD